MAAALREAVDGLSRESPCLAALRDRLIDGLTGLPHTRLTGDPVNRLPGTASFVFEGVEGEALLLHLDARGICASSGSACSSASLDPSHVLLAIGLPHAIAHGSLRLSPGRGEYRGGRGLHFEGSAPGGGVSPGAVPRMGPGRTEAHLGAVTGKEKLLCCIPIR